MIMYGVFERLVSQGKVERHRLISIRVKVHSPCQWACNFCHKEGSPSSQPVRNDTRFSEALKSFRDRFGLTEVHFTGGEPSIHPEIAEFIAKVKSLGLKAKLTTNGQAKRSRFVECIEAGLDELNMSVHTLDPAELGRLMLPLRSSDWGRKALDKQIGLIDALEGKISIKINTCVGETEAPAIALKSFLANRKVSWRLMNVLEMTDVSYATLKRICQHLGAAPVRASVINGSSSCSVDMLCGDGFAFKLKLIQPHFIAAMCSECELRKYGGCYEFAYGPRLEMDRGILMVRNCVHREGPPFSLPLQAYFSHPIAEQLQAVLGG